MQLYKINKTEIIWANSVRPLIIWCDLWQQYQADAPNVINLSLAQAWRINKIN